MSNLEYIILDEVRDLNDEVFLKMKNLKKIYCNNCPNIK